MAPIEEIFCEIDDFCKAFFPQFEGGLMKDCFPKMLSYNRFVEVQGRVFVALYAFIKVNWKYSPYPELT